MDVDSLLEGRCRTKYGHPSGQETVKKAGAGVDAKNLLPKVNGGHVGA